MRTLLLILFCFTATAQKDLRMAFSQYSHLGINGPVKTITIYKYTNLEFDNDTKQNTTGTLYSVIKNSYDSSGYIIKDSTITFINKRGSYIGYYRNYTLTDSIKKNTMVVTTFFERPPEQYQTAKATDARVSLSSFFVFKGNKDIVSARDYNLIAYNNLKGKKEMAIQGAYLFYLENSLIVRSKAEKYEPDIKHGKPQKAVEVYSAYEYDEYGNFTQTTEKVGDAPAKTIRHEVLTIDDYGNATMMLNFINDAKVPEFMTRYEIEYYD